MKRYIWIIIFANLLLFLVGFNWSVAQKERTLDRGEFVLLKLAPVDPRSLMQGDYMNLQYDTPFFSDDTISRKGFLVFAVDSNRVAQFVRLQHTQHPLSKDEIAIRYRRNNQFQISPGPNSYFFEEGQSESFEKAKYGGMRIDSKGNPILTGLYDVDLRLIKPRSEY